MHPKYKRNVKKSCTLPEHDMSITWGGLFDLGPITLCNHDPPDCQFWQTPHSEHRFGKTCDVQKPQILHPDLLEDIFRRHGVLN